VRVFNLVLAALIIWGPPPLRIQGRALNVALDNPFDLDGSAIFQVLIWAVAILGIGLRLLNRRVRIRLATWLRYGSIKWYLLYAVFALSSSIYSVRPLYTLFFAIKLIIGILAMLTLVEGQHPLAMAENVLVVFFGLHVCIAAVICTLYFFKPELVGIYAPGTGYRLNGGIFADYGASALLAGLFFLVKLIERREGKKIVYLALYAGSWVAVLASETRSTILAAALISVFAILLSGSSRLKIAIGWGVACLLSVSLVNQLYVAGAEFLARGQDTEAMLSLSGRTTAFTYLISLWQKAPLLGYGYSAGTRLYLSSFTTEYGLGIGKAHDAVSCVLVNLGVVGAVLLTLALCAGIWRVAVGVFCKVRIGRVRIVRIYSVSLMILAVVSSITGGGISELSFSFVIAVICADALYLSFNSFAMPRVFGSRLMLQRNRGFPRRRPNCA